VDSSGAIVATGDFSSQIDFGTSVATSLGQNDVFLAKFDLAGTTVWAKTFGSSSSDFGKALAIDSTGAIVVAVTANGATTVGGNVLVWGGNSDVAVVKFASNGSYMWARQCGDSDSQGPTAIAVDSSANIVITGQFSGALNFGNGAIISAGAPDVFIAKLSSTGSALWSRGIGDGSAGGGPTATAVAIDANGYIAVCGFVLNASDFGSGGLLFGPVSSTSWDAFVAKYSASGQYLWAKRAGNTGTDGAQALVLDRNGVATVAGCFQSSIDFGCGPIVSSGASSGFVVRLGQ
jgi:hypothetical protein